MPSITIKSIPEDLYDLIKRSAADHRRSINSEVIICLERSLLPHRVAPADYLAKIDSFREKLDLPPLNDILLHEIKNEGRP